MEWDYGEPEQLDLTGHGLYIVNEGNFQYGNATLSYYRPATNAVENEVFVRANGMKLGDVAQWATMWGGRLWVVVNNSHVIFALDPDTGRELGRVEGLTSPRQICFVSEHKAYVSQLWDNRIFIIDPATCTVTGHITVPGMSMESGSTEQMVCLGPWVYCTCWSYNNRIIRIDTATDRVDAEMRVGLQPRELAADCHGRLWTLTDGGYEDSPTGHEPPALWCIDPATLTIERQMRLPGPDTPRQLQLNAAADTLYWIQGGVMRMAVDSPTLPHEPLISPRGTIYYGLTVDPASGQVYVADAVDYQQPGMIYRYTPAGELLHSFRAGITPGAFCWR